MRTSSPSRARLRAALNPPPPASSNQLPGLLEPGDGPATRARRSICAPPDGNLFAFMRISRCVGRASAIVAIRCATVMIRFLFQSFSTECEIAGTKKEHRSFMLRIQVLDSYCKMRTKSVHSFHRRLHCLNSFHNLKVDLHGTKLFAACRGQIGGQEARRWKRHSPDRTGLRQGLDHEARRQHRLSKSKTISDGLAWARHRARYRRPAAGPGHRNLRAGKLGQDHAGAADDCRSPEEGRHLRLRRCRTRARSGLCPQARRRSRRPADLAARHRRAGAGNRRYAGALRRDRRSRHRFGRGADAAGRNRRRDGRSACPACRRA